MDKLSFAGLLATLYDSARLTCKRGNKKVLALVWAALPEQGLSEDKSKVLRLAIAHLEASQKESEAAVEYLQEYYGIKPKEARASNG